LPPPPTGGAWLDEIIMRGNDLIFAFPSLVIAILITARYGPSATNAILAIGIFNIPVFARVARGGALPLWTLDYILAARTSGKGQRASLSSTSCPTSRTS
jgi:peptide/nickel transport system permease protein